MLFATAIFLVFLHIAVGERSSLSRTHVYPETQIYKDYRQITDIPSLVYARCNSSQPNLGRECIVTMKIDVFDKSEEETKECQVNLKPALTYGVINDDIRVYAFGQDKVLLVWTETQSASDSEDDIEWSILKATVIHMFDDCRTFEANIRKDMGHPLQYFDQKYISVITFNNTFEMRLGKLKEGCKLEYYCDVDEYRLYKYDDRTREIGEAEYWPMPFLKGFYQLYSVEKLESDLPEKGYFISSQNTTHVLIELMTKSPSGNHHLWMWPNSSKPTFRWSVANKAVGFCYVQGNASFDCWQSDQQGKIHTRMNFTLDVTREKHLKTVYNLRNGGFLLAVSTYSKSDFHKSGRSKYHENSYLLKVDEKGNVNSVEVQFENMCQGQDSMALVKLFENKQDQYCIIRLCQSMKPRRLVKSRIESSVKCYSSDEFSKCTNCL